MVVHWLAQQEVHGLRSSWGLSVSSWHVLPVSVYLLIFLSLGALISFHSQKISKVNW